jgi:hypothetical protein
MLGQQLMLGRLSSPAGRIERLLNQLRNTSLTQSTERERDPPYFQFHHSIPIDKIRASEIESFSKKFFKKIFLNFSTFPLHGFFVCNAKAK